MALRVLLADESSTIKRVMQLALQDYGVDVKAVPVGIDVVEVAQSFQPDIIFADVLLAKRSGYDVCSDIKNDPKLARIPTVIMWSGFMEIDEARYRAARIDRKLEKPFDPDQLRKVISDLVPRLNTNSVSSYLQFPDRPEFIEPASEMPPEPSAMDIPEISLESLEDNDDFSHVPLPKSGNRPNNIRHEPTDEEWSRSNLQSFSADSGHEITRESLVDFSDSIEKEIEDSGVFWASTGDPVHEPEPVHKNQTSTPLTQQQMLPQLDFERVEQILRSQAREVIESLAWKILPDLTERIVREELQKLLKDADRLDQA